MATSFEKAIRAQFGNRIPFKKSFLVTDVSGFKFYAKKKSLRDIFYIAIPAKISIGGDFYYGFDHIKINHGKTEKCGLPSIDYEGVTDARDLVEANTKALGREICINF